MRRAITLMIAGAVCAVGGGIATSSLAGAGADPQATAAVSNAQLERAIVQTAYNTGYLRGIRDNGASIECLIKGGCDGVDRYTGSVVGLLDRINQSVMRLEQKLGN